MSKFLFASSVLISKKEISDGLGGQIVGIMFVTLEETMLQESYTVYTSTGQWPILMIVNFLNVTTFSHDYLGCSEI